MWFLEQDGNQIGRITPDGTITEYPIPTAKARPNVVVGADGSLWFTEFRANEVGQRGD